MNKKNLILLLFCLFFCMGAAITSDPWDGTGWNTSAPNEDAMRGQGYLELQDLRKGIEIRMNKEHVTFGSSSVGGAHIPGGCNILFYNNTAAIDANVTAGTFEQYGLMYDTTLRQLFTMNAAETAKVAITFGTAAIADSNVKTADVADHNITLVKMAVNSVDSDQYVDGSIDPEHFSAGAVKTDDMADSNVTVGKINFFIDEDSMTTDSAVKVPSQQSVKKYVDDEIDDRVGTAGDASPAEVDGDTDSITLPNGLIMKWGTASAVNAGTPVTFPVAFPNACLTAQVSINQSCSDSFNPASVYDLSKTGLTVQHYETRTVNWFAVGR